jgi:hypothetical protein
LRAGWQTNFIAAIDYILGNRQSSTISLVSVVEICSKCIVKRSELERESHIEQLRRIALLQHGAIETLVEQLRAKCKALAKFTGTSHAKEFQQTLALVEALVANQGRTNQRHPQPSLLRTTTHHATTIRRTRVRDAELVRRRSLHCRR